LPIARFGDRNFFADVARFVKAVADFKRIVRERGYQLSASAKKDFRDYFAETSGRRKRKAMGPVEVEALHGIVIQALHDWREPLAKHEKFSKTVLKDLVVYRKSRMSELYEVKTAIERSSMYSAIGQLLVHAAADPSVLKVVVVPRERGTSITSDVDSAIKKLGIEILWYRWKGTESRRKAVVEGSSRDFPRHLRG
jgi:hypothetical protein